MYDLRYETNVTDKTFPVIQNGNAGFIARESGRFYPHAAGAQTNGAAVAALPFVASAHRHSEPAFSASFTPTVSTQPLGQGGSIDVPAYGYLRHIILIVTAAGGAGGAGNADYPWNILQNITLADVNGTTIFQMDGYSAYIANLVGGYGFNPNLANNPAYVGSAPNSSWILRVPVEVSSKDGLGALSNQNAAANYKLSLTANTIAGTTSTAYTTAPTITVRGYLEAWTLPAPTDSRGRPQQQVPPLLGTGQYWSSRSQSVAVGNNTVQMTRVGNLIRNLVFISRTAAGARDSTVMMDPVQFNWDGVALHNAPQAYFTQAFFESLSGPVSSYPAGVFVLPFSWNDSGSLGDESPNGWLPTTQSSRLEITGNSASAGSIQVLTNEVAPVEIGQAQRWQDPSTSGTLANPNVTQ